MRTAEYDNDYLKKIWKAGENLAAKRYEDLWYTLLARNYTFPWWELDIVATKGDDLVFVEVKVVDYAQDLDGYISKKKFWFLQRAADYYLMEHPSDKELSLDVVFVQNNRIIEIFENVTNS